MSMTSEIIHHGLYVDTVAVLFLYILCYRVDMGKQLLLDHNKTSDKQRIYAWSGHTDILMCHHTYVGCIGSFCG